MITNSSKAPARAKFLTIAIAITIIGLIPELAKAQASATQVLQTAMASSLAGVFTELQALCIKYLGLFLLAQFILTHWKQMIEDSDIQKVLAKFVGAMFWAVFCLYIYENGADFIKGTASFVLNKASGLVGLPFSPEYPIDNGIRVASQLLETVDSTQGVLGSFNPFPSILMGLISVVILGASGVIAFRVFMVFVETQIVIALSPLAFALLGLNAFKDQGLTPFKYLVAMAYRIFLMAAILVAMTKFSEEIITAFKTLPASSDPSIWPPLWAAAMGYGILGALAWNSNAIASSLASGASTMTSSDNGGPAAIGAAVAGAIGAGLGAAGGALASSKPVQSMADWMKQAGAGAGGASISNAAMEGAGGLNAPLAKPEVPNMSMGGKGAGGGAGASPGSGAQVAATSNKSSSAATQTSNGRANAAGAVSKAGGSPQAAKAAGDAAAEEKNSTDIAAAAWGAGATPAQATAAAVAEALGSAGAGEQTIAAGVEAAAAGSSPQQIASAVEQAALGDVGMSGQDPGRFADMAASAASASRLPWVGSSSSPMAEGLRRDPERDAAREARREAAMAKKAGGSGESAGIGGTMPAAPRKGVMDYLKDAQHHGNTGPTHAVHVTMTTGRE